MACDPIEVATMSNPPSNTPSGQTQPPHQTQAQSLIVIGHTARLFKTPEGDLYAQCEVNGHWETWPLRERGSEFRRWLTRQYYQQVGAPPHPTAVTQAMEVLGAETALSGSVRPVFTRVAFHNGAIYLDLANEPREVVEISATGWH